MAKKNAAVGSNGKEINKSQAIRDMIAVHPKAKSREVVDLLAAKGIKVNPTLVYYVKRHEGKAKRQANRERAVETSRATGASHPVQVVSRLKELARDVGGMKALKQLVDMLAE